MTTERGAHPHRVQRASGYDDTRPRVKVLPAHAGDLTRTWNEDGPDAAVPRAETRGTTHSSVERRGLRDLDVADGRLGHVTSTWPMGASVT